ncbi:hypothetical protein L596_001233 [Steinernema carpocapsae]|uniref:Potassium channel domain-containing protein n=1 Tax=Steinernema carpocapsae TaxID=34508 RepID=A0A4U8ULP7_STECR|nr:hypothetical protein L596_001233 [Steinernema carpocapsae]
MTLLISHIQYRWRHVWIHIVLIILLICDVLVGAVVFRLLESAHEQEECQRVLKTKRDSMRVLVEEFVRLGNDSDKVIQERTNYLLNEYIYSVMQSFETPYGDCSKEMWSYPKTILFCSAALTTIGYGDVTPTTTLGRLALVIYGLLGVPLALVTLGDMAKFLANLFLKITLKAMKLIYPKREIQDYESSTILLWLIPICYPILMGIPMTYWEPSWTTLEAMYFSCISILSIGYGDYVPESMKSMLLTMTIVFIGLILNSMLIDIHYWGTFPESTKRFLKLVLRKATQNRRRVPERSSWLFIDQSIGSLV